MNFKENREKTNITQEQLASQLGIDRSTVAKWESGQSKPRADMLIKLSRIFGCTIDELLGIEKNTHP
ncbi:MAG: helix-turn-helix domain-containing protein [Eubacteriales bacterium]